MPDDLSAHVNLGLVLRTGGRLDAAIVEYREAIRLDPAPASYAALTGLLWDTGNVGEMVTVLQQAVERKPDAGALRHRLALSLLLAGDREGYRRACAATAERFRDHLRLVQRRISLKRLLPVYWFRTPWTTLPLR